MPDFSLDKCKHSISYTGQETIAGQQQNTQHAVGDSCDTKLVVKIDVCLDHVLRPNQL